MIMNKNIYVLYMHKIFVYIGATIMLSIWNF